MKPIAYILFSLLLMVATSSTLMAQERRSIIDELNRLSPGKGRVVVYQDEAIEGIVGRPMISSQHIYGSGDEQYIKMRGFKIQAFAGNDPRTAKNEAHSKQSRINSTFPDLETVVIFDSPFWRLRVGNFRTREEAEEVMKTMQHAFPSFGKEMYIVGDEVKIPVE